MLLEWNNSKFDSEMQPRGALGHMHPQGVSNGGTPFQAARVSNWDPSFWNTPVIAACKRLRSTGVLITRYFSRKYSKVRNMLPKKFPVPEIPSDTGHSRVKLWANTTRAVGAPIRPWCLCYLKLSRRQSKHLGTWPQHRAAAQSRTLGCAHKGCAIPLYLFLTLCSLGNWEASEHPPLFVLLWMLTS